MQMRQTGILDSIAAPAANPRMRQAAAEQIVDADVPNELQALVEKKKALELLQSAARREVMRQRPPPAPPQTTKTQVEGGIASLLKDLLPGLAQRGQQLRRMSTRRQAGLPTVPSNMRMAASGGIVGYDNGGVVGFNNRGAVSSLDAALEAEGITDPVAIDLIRAIYGQESSSGRNVKVSPAGARGPMQVMPATFVEMMGPDADINDPATNLRAGIRYAQQMLRRADGDPRLAAAAYYGGPDEIAKQRAGIDTQAPQEDFPSVSEYADEVTANMRTAPEGVDRLLNLDELSKDPQQVKVEAPRERPMSPEERRESLAANPDRIDNIIGNYIENYVKENPVETAATLAMLPLGGGLAIRGLGALGTRFAPRAGSTLSKLFTKPNPNVVRGPGFTMRPPGQGLRTFSPTRTGATLGATTLGVKGLYDRMTDGEDPATDAEAPAREPTAQEKLGSMVDKPTAKFKAGEAPKPGRDIDVDGLIAFLTSAQGTNTAAALGSGARGFTRQQLAERRRQDELDALAEKQKIDREQIAATLRGAEIRGEATINAAVADYLNDPISGYAQDVLIASGKEEIKDLTQADYDTYGPAAIQSFKNKITGQASALGFSPEDLAEAQAYLDAQA